MQNLVRVGSLVLIALTALSTVAAFVLYAFAFNSLASSGPSDNGFSFLSAANHSIPWISVLAVLGVIAASAHRPVVVPASCLAVAGCILGIVMFGAQTLALFLSHVDQAAQPPALNSFILAIAGSAHDVAPAAIVLLLGAIVLLCVRGIVVAHTRRVQALASATT